MVVISPDFYPGRGKYTGGIDFYNMSIYIIQDIL